jgi:polar amino acid transport system substrate-binding protein
MSKTTFIASLVCLSFLVPGASFARESVPKTITIVADLWLPYTGETKGQKGYLIELAEEAFRLQGISVRYQNLPWKRAILSIQNGDVNAAAGAYKSDVPNAVFTKAPLGASQNHIFVHKHSGWKYDGLKSLETIRLGAILNYSYGEQIDSYINAKNGSDRVYLVSSDNPQKRLIEMLLLGKIDAFIEDVQVMKHVFRSMKKEGEEIVSAGSAGPLQDVYIAFSPARKEESEKLAQILDDGLVQLRKSGKLEKILSRYQLKDWKTADTSLFKP